MFDFQGMTKAMEAMQSVDFDRLAAIPDQLDAIVRQLRIANVLITRILSPIDGAAAADMLIEAEGIVDGRDTRHRTAYVEP